MIRENWRQKSFCPSPTVLSRRILSVAVGQSNGKAALFLSLKALDLNQYVEDGTTWTLTTAHAINLQGQIVVSRTLNGETRAFLLTPLF